MRFSERYGYKPIRDIIQKDSMNEDLKTRIWSCIHDNYLDHYSAGIPGFENGVRSLWKTFFKKPVHNFSSLSTGINLKKINSFYDKCIWYEVYDLIEEIIKLYDEKFIKIKELFILEINDILIQEQSAYRIINNQITEITSEQEIQSIEEALENSNPFSGVQQHLNQALQLMSDRQKPDYRNSIKESISAVESICKIVTNDDKASLGQALKIIETKYGLHEALKKSLSQLYGYTSDADGIRHAMLEESNLTYIDAKFMLVACTNFINYLIDKTKDQN
ncbi:hypothetical protein SKM57_06745 [Acinetobacter faecalis]|uniref:AbiJ-NTD4 domain-containing protein n=1 Tax=Acinetobacter faecalis TaxID=2665161 RepID=UPI002A910FB3|nr:hypothetical protein [Acinetobacter faecalis]MDY6468283.1 hypothetical protein [Acinetobacter faecalis]